MENKKSFSQPVGILQHPICLGNLHVAHITSSADYSKGSISSLMNTMGSTTGGDMINYNAINTFSVGSMDDSVKDSIGEL